MRTNREYGAEERLLLTLLRRRTEPQGEAAILSRLREVDWRTFLAVTSEDLYPYLAFCLEPYIDLVDVPTWARFSRARRLTAVHNLLLRHELGRILEALKQRGIPVLALKGVILAYTAYPDPSLRPMSDIDFLVPLGRREEAILLLQEIGYSYPVSVLALKPDTPSRLGANQEFAPPLRHCVFNVLIEVHSQLECAEPVLPASIREFWSRSLLVDLNGLKVGTLCPDDFLFHVCLHQSRAHRFDKGLLPLVDIKVLLASRGDWNWERVAERSRRWGCATWMYLTLTAARDLVGAPVPDKFFRGLVPPSDLARLGCMTGEQLWAARSQQPKPLFLSELLSEPSWRKRVSMFVRRMRFVGKEELGSKSATAKLVGHARLTLRRLAVTFKIKIPQYIDAWRSGQLEFRNIRRRAMLLRASDTLFQLVEQERWKRQPTHGPSMPK